MKDNPTLESIAQGIIPDLHNLETKTRKQQFELIASISNYHRMGYPTTRNNTTHIIYPDNIMFAQHMLHDIDSTINEDGNFIRTHLPLSPRLRLMYFLSTGQENEFHQLLKHLINLDHPQEPGLLDAQEEVLLEPPRKKRKQSARIVSVSRQAIAAEIGADIPEINAADPMRKLYIRFTEELILNGIIRWRFNTESEDGSVDICVMNDYSKTTGMMLPQGFVHVTCNKYDGEYMVECTCAIFDVFKRAAHQSITLQPGEDAIPEASCMHCRFFNEHLRDAYIKLQVDNSSLSSPMQMVLDSLEHMKDEVQIVGNVVLPSCTKFSVKGEKEYAILNVSFHHGKCNVICTNGMCAVGLKNKKNIARRDLDDFRKMKKALNIADGSVGRKSQDNTRKRIQCSHLDTFYNNLEYVQSFFPEYFASEEEEENQFQFNVAAEVEAVNNEDRNIAQAVDGNFDKETGLWKFKALTTHKPRRMMDPRLVRKTQMRNEMIRREYMDEETGKYGTLLFKPRILDENGNAIICACGQPYINDAANYVPQGSGTLYTRSGPLAVEYFNLQCQQGICAIPFTESAEQKCVFMFTKNTCIGDEIAWDFVSMVMTTKCSFTGYCNEMTRRYQTNSFMSAPFMSPNTFVQVFFGWMAAHKTDFRKVVDPWCKYAPKMLACDGTHIGVSMRHMKIDPIEQPNIDAVYAARHQRNDRVLIPDKGSRLFLRYLCMRQMNKKIKASEILTPAVEYAKSQEFLEKIAAEADPAVYELLRVFVNKTVHAELIDVLARLFFLMSGDAALSSVLPFLSHDLIEECIEDMEGNGHVPPDKSKKVETFCMEIAQLMLTSARHGFADTAMEFCKYLLQKIKTVHNRNRPVPDVEEIPGTYDPRRGTAYYFTESGNQLRKMPVYSVSGKEDKCHCDNGDAPDIDKCTKYYPRSNFGGFGYIFLWFCPIHGHSYGFHCINSGEGRKDVFSSLYKYIETPPEHIFYDFACQLHEYCLNREPELFKNTRFWHDLFHSIGHVCGENFKTTRVTGLGGLNTSICEQWNSFLQCMKYTGSHLSQEHFSFLLQFFISRRNIEKTETYGLINGIALAGLL